MFYTIFGRSSYYAPPLRVQCPKCKGIRCGWTYIQMPYEVKLDNGDGTYTYTQNVKVPSNEPCPHCKGAGEVIPSEVLLAQRFTLALAGAALLLSVAAIWWMQ